MSIGRLRRLNTVAALAFTVGGALFALGAAVAQFGSSGATGAWIYFAGGLFFNTGGYTSLLQAINAPARRPAGVRWLHAPGRGGATSRPGSTG